MKLFSLTSYKDSFVLELDFEPFTDSFPRPTLSKSIGNGVQFLNRHLSSKMFHDKESMHPLLDFLGVHSYKGKVGALPLIYNFSASHFWLFFFTFLSFSLVTQRELLRNYIFINRVLDRISFLVIIVLGEVLRLIVYATCHTYREG